jgi:hypothetical protein
VAASKHQHLESPVSSEGGAGDRPAPTGGGGALRGSDLRLPWGLDADIPYFYGTERVYYVRDRLGVRIGVYFDLMIALAVIELANGSSQIQGETG